MEALSSSPQGTFLPSPAVEMASSVAAAISLGCLESRLTHLHPRTKLVLQCSGRFFSGPHDPVLKTALSSVRGHAPPSLKEVRRSLARVAWELEMPEHPLREEDVCLLHKLWLVLRHRESARTRLGMGLSHSGRELAEEEAIQLQKEMLELQEALSTIEAMEMQEAQTASLVQVPSPEPQPRLQDGAPTTPQPRLQEGAHPTPQCPLQDGAGGSTDSQPAPAPPQEPPLEECSRARAQGKGPSRKGVEEFWLFVRAAKSASPVKDLADQAQFPAARALWHEAKGDKPKALLALNHAVLALGGSKLDSCPESVEESLKACLADKGARPPEERKGCPKCRWCKKGCPPSCAKKKASRKRPASAVALEPEETPEVEQDELLSFVQSDSD